MERTWISGPIVFAGFGFLVSPDGLDLLSFETDREMLKSLAELSLALILFSDATLGKAVVSNEAVPEPIRDGLNLESGLNDGICVPILLVFLTLAQDVEIEGETWPFCVSRRLSCSEEADSSLPSRGACYSGASRSRNCRPSCARQRAPGIPSRSPPGSFSAPP